MKKLSAKEKAIQLIGTDNVELLEHAGIHLSWEIEYTIKEFVLAAENEETVLRTLDQLKTVEGALKWKPKAKISRLKS